MVLAAVAVVYVLLFAYYLRATIILQPYWDMYTHIVRYLQYQQDGNWWSYFWEPHVQHRHVWMRLLTAFDVEVFAGVAYPFIVVATGCQLVTAWVLYREVRAGAPRQLNLALGAFVVMLVLTSVSAVDAAIPMNGIYPQALMFSVLALVLFDGKGERAATRRYGVHARRIAALAAAMGAAFANAAALVVWPILLWASWRGRTGWVWTAAVGAIGGAFCVVYLNGLPLAPLGDGPGSVSAVLAGGAERWLATSDYFVTYLGLPWTRAAALSVPGRVLGAVLLAAGVWAVVSRGLARPALARLDRLAVALILFSLGSALLAAVNRADIPAEVLVPVRYSVFVTPIHVGLLLLAWPSVVRAWMAASRRRLVEAGMIVAAAALLVQQVAVGQVAAATTRTMRATIDRFVAGEQTDDMTSVVFINLEQARRQLNAIRGAGLYLDVR